MQYDAYQKKIIVAFLVQYEAYQKKNHCEIVGRSHWQFIVIECYPVSSDFIMVMMCMDKAVW